MTGNAPQHLIVLDFETYYSRDFSLSKLTTEEYIRSPEFEVIGVSVKLDDEPAVWCAGDDLEVFAFLQKFPWDKSLAVAHNAMFDMAILSWKYGIKPLALGDTLSMARALHGSELSLSLKTLAAHYKLQAKGEEVVAAMGMRRADFSPHGLKTYGAYCINDTEITASLFQLLAAGFRTPFGDDIKQLIKPGFPRSEMRLIDQTLRMFTEPVLGLDKDVLVPHLQDVKHKKALLMAEIDVQREDLMSNPKLAESLRKLGVEPPTKISTTTGKETFAFSKSDSAFTDLLEHPDLPVQALVAARLGVKSTLEETRTERFIDMADRGLMPVPLRYYGAHTGRWSGSDKINLQNITRESNIKKAITAPEGHVIIDCDSSQIEARVLAWLAGQEDLVNAFDRGEDVYSIMASNIYGKPVEEIDKPQRFLGKTVVLGCLAEGTLVLTRRGWVPIEAVEPTDLLWDGDAWVGHEGLIPKGTKETLSLSGLWLTPDHRVLCGTQWLEAASLEHDESTLSLALATGAVSWLSPDMLPGQGAELAASSYAATVSGPSMSLTTTTSKTSAARDAPRAGAGKDTKNAIGCIPPLWPMTPTGHGSLIGYLQPSRAATTQLTAHTQLMEGEVSLYVRSGVTTEPRSSHTCKPYPAGTSPSSKWTASTTLGDTSPATYGSLQGQKIWVTAEPSASCRRNLMTYDLAYAGPKNRYTVLTNAGPIIVHNCGYGTGWSTFQRQLKLKGVSVTDDTAQSIIQTYREAYPRIPLLWKEAGRSLDAILGNVTAPLGTEGALVVEGDKGVRLPNGLYIRYPNLRREYIDGQYGLVYDTKRGRSTVMTRIHGPKMVENVTQALARIIIGDQLLMVARRYRVALTVHDSIVAIAPASEEAKAVEYITGCMRVRPKWAPTLPLSCEAKTGVNYG